MPAVLIRAAGPADRDWIRETWMASAERIGTDFHRTWWRYWREPRRGHWLVAPAAAFVRFNVRRDGLRHVSEIAVRPECRGAGLGRALLDAVGRPCYLWTDADNAGAGAFYRACGFALSARGTNRKGKPIVYFARP